MPYIQLRLGRDALTIHVPTGKNYHLQKCMIHSIEKQHISPRFGGGAPTIHVLTGNNYHRQISMIFFPVQIHLTNELADSRLLVIATRTLRHVSMIAVTVSMSSISKVGFTHSLSWNFSTTLYNKKSVSIWEGGVEVLHHHSPQTLTQNAKKQETAHF